MKVRYSIIVTLFLFTVALFLNGHKPQYVQTGWAAYYSSALEGKPTASGETFNNNHFTAAHPTLPFGTRLKVVNLANGRHVKVRVNDRGPFTKRRIIDLSQAAFKKLAPLEKGILKVRIEQVNGGKRIKD